VAGLNPDKPDITRTSAFCPATSLPGQTGHIPLGMSGCPVSGLGEAGRQVKTIEKWASKPPRYRDERSNCENAESRWRDRRPSTALATECAAFQHEPTKVTVTWVTCRVTNYDNSLPGASHRSNRVTQPLEMLRFRPIARCLPIIGGIYARVAAASFTLVERKTRPRDRSRNLEMARYVGDGPAARGGVRGVDGDPGALGITDIFRLLRGAFEKFGRPSKENLVNK
jgi:hypothetical protein